MPRRPRLHLPGIPQHVIQRGTDRRPMFFSDDDYFFYLDLLKEYSRKRDISVYAYCLMTNHLHLLLEAPKAESLPGLMQDMGRRYVQYVNRTYHRTGGLWEGRYKAGFVQSDRYLLTCMRYVELNPVRACMVTAPGEYRWSSYRANAHGEQDELVTSHHEYLAMGKIPEVRQESYRRLFVGSINDPDLLLIRTATQQGVFVSDSHYAKTISERLCLSMLPAQRGRPRKQ